MVPMIQLVERRVGKMAPDYSVEGTIHIEAHHFERGALKFNRSIEMGD
jgi:hypothetical protein